MAGPRDGCAAAVVSTPTIKAAIFVLTPRTSTKRIVASFRELLAKALRDRAVLESQHEGFQAELDLTQATVQCVIFRDEFAFSREPYLLLNPRKGMPIVDISEAYGTATMTSSAKIAAGALFRCSWATCFNLALKSISRENCAGKVGRAEPMRPVERFRGAAMDLAGRCFWHRARRHQHDFLVRRAGDV